MLGFYARNLHALFTWNFCEVKNSGEFGSFMVQVAMLGPATVCKLVSLLIC